jgi:hypothetical protein
VGFHFKILWACVLCLCLSKHNSYAQKDKPSIPLEYFYADPMKNNFRELLSKLNFSYSTGYGRTIYQHEFEGLGILQKSESLPVIFISSTGTSTQFSNWFNDITLQNPNLTPDYLSIENPAKIGFRSSGFNVPIKFSVHAAFDRFRLGGGLSYEYMRIGEFEPINFRNEIKNFDPGISGAMARRMFLLIGANIISYYEYNLVADLNVGSINLGRNFNNELIDKGAYFNLGLQLEREFSEYFKVFIRPSVEWKTYTIGIPETSLSIRHNLPAAFVNVGATLRIAELARCKIKNCHAQVDHRHDNLVVRSRMHPFYKKQNPHYGENYPRLIRYKWQNKNKLNPY